jgi:hypothetical protein
MINDFETIIEAGIKNKDVTIFGKYTKELSMKYDVSEKTLYNRFKSIYNKSPRDLLKLKIMPTKEVFTSLILNSIDSDEVFSKLNLPHTLTTGIYDKYFGVSTFKNSKIKILAESYSVDYYPVREDNRSLIYSQLLGDGSYDKRRHALRISHGDKQAEYLKWKVSLLNVAYPKTSKEVKRRVHTQGHIYWDYYTPLGNIDIIPEEECVNLLTNLGWLLWFLDDGSSSGQDISICCKRNPKIRELAIKELATYGIVARDCGHSFICAGHLNSLGFYHNFIKPFINKIPKCMQYKVEEIVEKLNISYSI